MDKVAIECVRSHVMLWSLQALQCAVGGSQFAPVIQRYVAKILVESIKYITFHPLIIYQLNRLFNMLQNGYYMLCVFIDSQPDVNKSWYYLLYRHVTSLEETHIVFVLLF